MPRSPLVWTFACLIVLLASCVPRPAGEDGALTLFRGDDDVVVIRLASMDRDVTVQVQASTGLEAADEATSALCHPTSGMDNALSCPVAAAESSTLLRVTGEEVSAIATWRCGVFACFAPGRVE